ncbi:DNA-binding anti-repressor SinI [Halobacillus fulvus]|nr:DNA-binding anti-repressor SinI [Halobacillus fulvus]
MPDVQKLDVEWVALLEEAKSIGLSKEEIREFIESSIILNQAK